MQDDKLGGLGFAQVLQRAGTGNLSQLAALAQKKKDSDRDYAYKQQQDAIKTGQDMQKGLLLSKLTPILSDAQQKMFKETVDGMSTVSRRVNMGQTEGASEAYSQLKGNYDSMKSGLDSIQGEVDSIEKMVMDDKDGLINKDLIGGQVNDLLKKSLITDQSGRPVGINYDEAANFKRLRENPDIYNDDAVIKNYMGTLGQLALENQVDGNGSTLKQSGTSGLFEVEKGKIKLDKNTGLPVPKASPESIAEFDKVPLQKKKLDSWAAKDGISRSDAFKKYVASKGTYKEELVTKSASSDGSGAAEKEANANDRYKTIRSIVDNFDASALAQGFSLGDKTKAVFKGGGSLGNLPGENKPDRIVIQRREPIPVTPSAENPTGIKYTNWADAEEIPIRNEQQKDAAAFIMNSLLNESGNKSGNIVGQDDLRKVHNKYKASKPTPIDLGF